MRTKSTHRKRHLDELASVHPDAAGLDIGSAEIVVAIPPDRDPEPVRVFRTFTPDLHALVAWLVACGIDTVAMESTGVFVRRITAYAIPPTGRLGSEGNPRVNDLPCGESQREQQHVVEAERPRRRV